MSSLLGHGGYIEDPRFVDRRRSSPPTNVNPRGDDLFRALDHSLCVEETRAGMPSSHPPYAQRGEVSRHRDGGVRGNTTGAHDPSVAAGGDTSPRAERVGRKVEPERRSGMRSLPAGVEAHLRGMIGTADMLGDQLDIVRRDGLLAIGPVHDLLQQLEVQGRELRAMVGDPSLGARS